MNKTALYIIFALAALALSGFLGYLIGSSYTETPEKVVEVITKYEKLPADTIKIMYPEPYKVYDTITDLQTIYVDTAKSIDDYFKVREYYLDFSNDTLGKFVVETKVHQNSLMYAEAQIEPIIKTVTTTKTEYKVKALQIYAMLGSSVDLRCNQIQAGVDVADKYVFGVSGVRLGDKVGYTLNVGLKF